MRTGGQRPAYGLATLLLMCLALQVYSKKNLQSTTPQTPPTDNKAAQPKKPHPKPIPVTGGDVPDYVQNMKKISGSEKLGENGGDEDIEQSIFVPKGATLTIEAETLNLKKGARIVVMGKLVARAAKSSPIIIKTTDNQKPGSGISCLGGGSIALDGVEFKGLGNAAIQPNGVLVLTDCDASVKGCEFTNIKGTAIKAMNGKLKATRNKFDGVNGTCISVTGTQVSDISESTFDGCVNGAIQIRKASKTVSIEENTFTNNGAYAVSLEQCYDSFKVSNNNFTGNYGAFKARSVLYDRDEKLIVGSEFSKNTITKNDVDVSSDFYAKGNIIYLDSVAAVVDDNLISDNTFDIKELEQHNKKEAKDITGSVINMWDSLVTMDRNTIQRNKAFSRVLTAGGQQKGASKYNFTTNLFINNTVKFVIFNDGPALIDAKRNYWGISGATFTATTWIPEHIFDFEDSPQVGVVDYEPWLIEPRLDSTETTTEEAKKTTDNGYVGPYGGDNGFDGDFDDEYYGYNDGYDQYYHFGGYDTKYGDYYDDVGNGAVPTEPKHTIIKTNEEWSTDTEVVKNVIITKAGRLLIQPRDTKMKVTMLRGSYIRVDGVLQIFGVMDFEVIFESDQFDDEGWRSIFFSPAAMPFNFTKFYENGEEFPAVMTKDYGCFISHAVFKGGGVLPKVEELQAGEDDNEKKKKKKKTHLTQNQVGMVIVSGTTLYVEASEFSNSFSSGLVSSEHVNSTLYVTSAGSKQTIFKSNSANGISHRSRTTLVVRDCHFEANSEYAIITKQGKFNISKSRFSDNEGGVLCVAVKRSTVEKKADALDDEKSWFVKNRIQRNSFGQGDSCWSPDSDKEYRLAAFGSGSVNIIDNDFSGNLAPQDAVRNNADLVMLRVDKAVQFMGNKIEESSGTIYLGSYFVAEDGHVPDKLEIVNNEFTRNNRFSVVVTANARRVSIVQNNVTDCSVTDHAPFPPTPILFLRGESLHWPMEVSENEFLGNDGTQVFLRAQAPVTAKDNLFDNPYIKSELWVEHLDVKAPNNWWGNETAAGVAKRIRVGPDSNVTVSSGTWKNWMLVNGDYMGTSTWQKEQTDLPGYINSGKRKSDGGAGAGVVIVVILFVGFIIGLVVMFVRKSRGGSLMGPSRPYKPVN